MRRDVTAITGFLSLLLSLSHTRLLDSALSPTRSHGCGCEKSSVGPIDRLSLSLLIRDDDDDDDRSVGATATSGSRYLNGLRVRVRISRVVVVVVCIYAPGHVDSRDPEQCRNSLSEKPLSAVCQSRDFFLSDRERGRSICCVTIDD